MGTSSGVARITLAAVFNNGAFACPGAVEDLPRGALREIQTVPTLPAGWKGESHGSYWYW